MPVHVSNYTAVLCIYKAYAWSNLLIVFSRHQCIVVVVVHEIQWRNTVSLSPVSLINLLSFIAALCKDPYFNYTARAHTNSHLSRGIVENACKTKGNSQYIYIGNKMDYYHAAN